MANNKNNNNGQNTSPFNRSNNIGNKSNQISELDLINVNAEEVKKELGDVFSYVNDNLKSLSKTINNDIYNNTKKVKSSSKTVFDNLFQSLDKYSNRLDDALDKMNQLGTGLSSNDVVASTSSSRTSKVVYDKAIFNNATFNNAVFKDVKINKTSKDSVYEDEPYRAESNRFAMEDTKIKKYNESPKGSLNALYDRGSSNSLIGNWWNNSVNEQREKLRANYEKFDKLTDGGRLGNTETLTKLSSIASGIKDIGSTLLKFAKPYWDKAKNSFEENYTKVAGLTSPEQAGNGGFLGINTGTDMFNEMLDSTTSKYGKTAFSYSSEMIPAMTTALQQGFQENNAILKAQEDMVASKVLPWLDTTSDAWINMSFNMDKTSLDQIKNQQLILKETESGNRILQTGIANQLTQDFAPLLTNLDTNVGIFTAKETMGEYYDYMQGLINSGQATPQAAYAAAKDMMKAQQNPFEALTSGNVSQILLGSQFAEGATVKQAYEQGLQPLLQQEAGAVASGDVTGAGAMQRAFGTQAYTENGWIQTVGKFAGNFGTEQYGELTEGTSTDKFDSLVGNISDYNTTDKQYKNWMENTVSDATQFMKNLPVTAISEIAGTTKAILGTLIGMAITRIAFGGGSGGAGGLLNMGIVNALRSGTTGTGVTGALGRFGAGVTGNGTVGLAGKIGAGLTRGGITAGGASTATAALAGITGLAAGGFMGYQDAKSAIENKKKWGVDSSTAAGIGGFFGGGEASAGNVASNALKWGAIGAGIGSFIPGVGTLIGGGIGALAGAVMGGVGGDTLSQMNQDIGDAVTGNNEYKSAYAIGNHATGLTVVSKDNYKANLHKGEMVANAKTASALRKSGVTGKELTESEVLSKLNPVSAMKDLFDMKPMLESLKTISDNVVNIRDVNNIKKKNIKVKFDNKVDTNLIDSKDKKDK